MACGSRRLVLPLRQLRMDELHRRLPDVLPGESTQRLPAQYCGLDSVHGDSDDIRWGTGLW